MFLRIIFQLDDDSKDAVVQAGETVFGAHAAQKMVEL